MIYYYCQNHVMWTAFHISYSKMDMHLIYPFCQTFEYTFLYVESKAEISW